jgi:hypothetical protein
MLLIDLDDWKSRESSLTPNKVHLIVGFMPPIQVNGLKGKIKIQCSKIMH